MHHLSAVNFYRNLAGPKFVGGLLVEHAGYDHSHDFALSASQGSISLLQGGALGLFLTTSGIFRKSLSYGFEERVIAEGFCQKFECTRFHRLH